MAERSPEGYELYYRPYHPSRACYIFNIQKLIKTGRRMVELENGKARTPEKSGHFLRYTESSLNEPYTYWGSRSGRGYLTISGCRKKMSKMSCQDELNQHSPRSFLHSIHLCATASGHMNYLVLTIASSVTRPPTNGYLVGRMDAKAHRKEGIFEVKSVHAEKHFTPDDEYNVEFKNALDTFACWHGTPDILFLRELR